MSKHVGAALGGAVYAVLVAVSVSAQTSPAAGFIPDQTFQGSALTGWRPVGSAQWSAANGVITATASAGGGWLMSEKGFQDVGVFTRFRCTGTCDAGVLVRAEQTPTGMKGIFVSLRPDSVAPYRVTLDTNGRILTRELARGAGGGGGGGGAAPSVRIATADWNSIEVTVEGNAVANHLNQVRGGIPGGTAQVLPPPAAPSMGGAVIPPDTTRFGFGPVALYVGSGTVQFERVGIKDLLRVKQDPERTSPRFRVQRVNDFMYSWGADIADVDRDGAPDFISGPFYYRGPDFLERIEFYPARVFNPGLEYVNDMLTLADDWTGDGWTDIMVTERRPLALYVNPRGESRRWDRVLAVQEACSETVVRGNVDQDPRPEVVFVAGDGRVAYAEPDPANPTGPWLVRKISDPMVGGCNTHGVGIGDLNGDGRADILQTHGWWEQPATNPAGGAWVYHEVTFGRSRAAYGGGGELAVYDFNGDGLNDVVGSLNAHGWGLAWWEQKRDARGTISFVQHTIMDDFSTPNAGNVTFSQPHSGAALADVDRDGVMDFVTGKRHWSHLDAPGDPDAQGDAVTYWYRTMRNTSAPGGVEFVPELIHNRSGVGSEVKAIDINRDGAVDFVTAGSRGAFVFWGVPSAR